MERCPNCRARLTNPPICYRCGADLSLPLRAERLAEQLERESIRLLLDGDLMGTLAMIERLQTVKQSPLAKVLVGFCERLGGSGEQAGEE